MWVALISQAFISLQIRRFTAYDVNVDSITHDELHTLTSRIHHKSRADLETILVEAERAGKGDLLKGTWKQDVVDRAAFQKDQKRNNFIQLLQCTKRGHALATCR